MVIDNITPGKLSNRQKAEAILSAPLPPTRQEREIILKEYAKVALPIVQPKMIAMNVVATVAVFAIGLGVRLVLRK